MNKQYCYSRGNILAKLMIVGQSPGKMEVNNSYEDPTTNRHIVAPVPFVGPAGVLLMSLLRWFDIKEGDYIMTNTLQYMPTHPGGRLRQPTEEEILADRPRLVKEIMLLKPKFIMALGKEAMWSTAYKNEVPFSLIKITKYNGKLKDIIFEQDGETFTTKVLTLFHPSYLRRLQTDPERHDDFKIASKAVTDALISSKIYIEEAVGRKIMLNR